LPNLTSYRPQAANVVNHPCWCDWNHWFFRAPKHLPAGFNNTHTPYSCWWCRNYPSMCVYIYIYNIYIYVLLLYTDVHAVCSHRSPQGPMVDIPQGDPKQNKPRHPPDSQSSESLPWPSSSSWP
jgi:hypothetical protein